MTFDDRTAIATGARQFNLLRRPLVTQPGFRQNRRDLLGIRLRIDGINSSRDANAENGAFVQGLAHLGIVEPQVTADGMDREFVRTRHAVNSGLGLIDQRRDIAGVIGIPFRDMKRKDKTGCRFRQEARLAAKLSGTVAFALHNGGDGVIIGADDFAMAEGPALGEPPRLGLNGLIVLESILQLGAQTLTLVGVEVGRSLEMVIGLLGPLSQGLSQREQMSLALAHHFDEHCAVASALAPKATHCLFKPAHQDRTLDLKHAGWFGDDLSNVTHDVENFFWAL